MGSRTSQPFAPAAMLERARSRESFVTLSQPWKVKGKHGEPVHWDGLASAFVALARDRINSLSATERKWLAALEQHWGSAAKQR